MPLEDSELEYKARLDAVCACGHEGHVHGVIPRLGGPEGAPCWVEKCPCYSFPKGWSLAEKESRRLHPSNQ